MEQPVHWQGGEVRITRVQDLAAPGMQFLVPRATRDNLATIPWRGPFLAATGEARGSVQALVLDVGARRILVGDLARAGPGGRSGRPPHG